MSDYRQNACKGRLMDFQGKKVLVIGTGLSGVGAAEVLCKKGAQVLVLEQNEKADEAAIREKIDALLSAQERERLAVHVGGLPEGTGAGSFDLVVPSPAVPLDSPIITSFRDAGIPVISEIELGSLFEKGKIIAITGTNGKTTTTTLVGEIMKAVDPKVFVVGNIGRSYAAASIETTADSVTVGEISSFQLEAAFSFHPAVCAILNITPDHLNRHYTMENYAAIKERIGRNQTPGEACVLNYEVSLFCR